MPELRRDPIAGNWTIIATERGWRPIEFKPKKNVDERPCPFCEGHEQEAPNEIYAIRKEGSALNTPGWEVRAIYSMMPILWDEGVPIERFGQGIYDVMDAVGKHELVIESPEHKKDIDEFSVEHLTKVISVYVRRFKSFEEERKYKYALLYKNHGHTTGSARDIIRHARTQIITLPITPKRVKEELIAAKNYYEYRNRCVFCDILKQEKSDGTRIITENRSFVAFCPFASRHPFEMWILPKRHSPDFGHLEPENFADLATSLRDCLRRLSALLSDPPYNLIMHTAPFRHLKKETYWKTLDDDYHWYLQISPRMVPSAGFEWGSGIYINPTPPEDAAALLRDLDVGA